MLSSTSPVVCVPADRRWGAFGRWASGFRLVIRPTLLGCSTIRCVRPERGTFDLNQLSRSIEIARADRELTWGAISHAVGVATSTIRRFGKAADAEADGVLALIGWLGLPPEEFVSDTKVAGRPLPPAAQPSGVSIASLTRWSPT